MFNKNKYVKTTNINLYFIHIKRRVRFHRERVLNFQLTGKTYSVRKKTSDKIVTSFDNLVYVFNVPIEQPKMVTK